MSILTAITNHPITQAITHAIRVTHATVREHIGKKLDSKRSPEWGKVRKAFLKDHPTCAACGGKSLINVHHICPFHSKPELELDPTNFISLCTGKLECHVRIGHGDNFKSVNISSVPDAAEVLAHPEKFDEVAARAKANRIPNEPKI